MIRRSFEYVVRAVRGGVEKELHESAYESLQIEGVSTDSRTIKTGNLFIPLDIGDRFDGHNFVREAFAKGAAAALWQVDRLDPPQGVPLIYVENTLAALQELASVYRRDLAVRVIGITGSNGKTTTKDMVAGILATTYKVLKTPGNLNSHIGLPQTILQLAEDTEMAVFEMGMRGRGEIELLAKLALPDAVIITNVGEAHLQQLGSRQEIAKAKLEILAGLKEEGLFIYNGDEPLLEQFLSEAKQPKAMLRFRFGSNTDNDFYPSAIMNDQEGSYFHLNIENSLNYYVPVLGSHNVINALAAIAVGKFMGVADKDIVHGLRSMEMTGMRIEQVRIGNHALVLNDAWNASPTSMKAAIRLLVEMKGFNRKIIVLGDMLELGKAEIEYHLDIGRELPPKEIDYVFAFGSLAKYIAVEARNRFSGNKVKWFTDKTEMIRQLKACITEGDLILIKGSRGMKLEEVVYALKAGVL